MISGKHHTITATTITHVCMVAQGSWRASRQESSFLGSSRPSSQFLYHSLLNISHHSHILFSFIQFYFFSGYEKIRATVNGHHSRRSDTKPAFLLFQGTDMSCWNIPIPTTHYPLVNDAYNIHSRTVDVSQTIDISRTIEISSYGDFSNHQHKGTKTIQAKPSYTDRASQTPERETMPEQQYVMMDVFVFAPL